MTDIGNQISGQPSVNAHPRRQKKATGDVTDRPLKKPTRGRTAKTTADKQTCSSPTTDETQESRASDVKERPVQPLLAATLADVKDVQYPCGVTAKVDGIRAIKVDGKMVTRTFKPIRNKRMAQVLSAVLPEGGDGEITCGNFQETTSAVMREAGSEGFEEPFTFHLFDIMPTGDADKGLTYQQRMDLLRAHMDAKHDALVAQSQVTVIPLYPEIVENEEQLRALEEKYLSEGFEGAMIRRMDGPYKFGRATLKSGILSKLKRFADAEATVIGFEELMTNGNVAEEDAFGRSKRGHSKEGLVGAGTLGSLFVRREDDGVEFNIGTGFDAATRKQIWDDRDSYLGKQVTYKHFSQGVKVAPRFPSFVGFREDL